MSASLFPLPILRSLAIAGPDARNFLQNQLSADLDEVADTCGQFSAWHDPKGRVLAILRVLPWREGFLLAMNARLAGTIGQRLAMFVLRSRVTLQPGPPVFGLAAPDAAGVLALLGLEASNELLSAASDARASALRMPGRAGWLVAGDVSTGAEVNDPSAIAAWEHAELEAGIPEVYPETSGLFVAQMLNLDRIGAVSFTKGCYPGQEIVARAHHLGRVKRRARLFRASGTAPAPGETLAASGGIVVRAASSNEGCLVMAVVTEAAPGPFALADGRPLEPFPPADAA